MDRERASTGPTSRRRPGPRRRPLRAPATASGRSRSTWSTCTRRTPTTASLIRDSQPERQRCRRTSTAARRDRQPAAAGGHIPPVRTEREGFEERIPSDEVDPRHTISSRARSAAPAPLLERLSLAARRPRLRGPRAGFDVSPPAPRRSRGWRSRPRPPSRDRTARRRSRSRRVRRRGRRCGPGRVRPRARPGRGRR